MATYTKLKSGEWGIRVEGENAAKKGDSVTVTKKDGSTKSETVKAVLWTGNGITLCAIAQRSNGGYRGGYSRSCSCSDGCCDRGCRCESHCNCRGGNVYDC
ncbi:MAG: hypothetical protein L0229_20350 [Blastocatellia bacterium]|nr:hypothetical protein [Blastocatellia bacterium]